ncbi:hypothetical protein OBBRIDRAFT_825731 [Obba rivulosa]|uniref:Uncharacterized protein n=1 Tax=Obba rivulosa TaxID=1052685 RepID=A0A8E2B264_9APHY|nr:hypothetical protein OBBRIDRAFT_825731 [Obba rivulosa]
MPLPTNTSMIASAPTEELPPPEQWATERQRMSPSQERMLVHLAREHSVHLPFLDPASPRYQQLPSKVDARILIDMLKSGQTPAQDFVDSLPEAQPEEITAPYEWQAAEDTPSEAMLHQLRSVSAKMGVAVPDTAGLKKADVAAMLRALDHM